jgi:hypothetical protein
VANCIKLSRDEEHECEEDMENCEAAAMALKQMVGTQGASGQGFVQFTCVKK